MAFVVAGAAGIVIERTVIRFLYVVLERGEVVLAGRAADMVESDVRRYLTV